MAKLILMPEIAANATSAVIKQWSKKEGDRIVAGDSLAEIETDKALIEFATEDAGILGKILVAAGKDIAVGLPIAVLLQDGDTDVDIAALLATAGSSTNATTAAHATAADAAPIPSPAAAVATPAPGAGRVFASPLARRLARERGIVLTGLTGSGPHGRIVKRDVEAAAPLASAKAAAVIPVVPVPDVSADYEEVPHTAMRRTIARRLTESKATIPHFYLTADCRMDQLIALRADINASASRKISVNDLIVKAVAASLRDMPEMNVGWSDSGLRKYRRADIAIAVSTDGGLITPVVRDADGKALTLISAEIAGLAARARDGSLAPSEYQGGSFTISNLGMFGVRDFAAIINPPQAAILAVGAASARPVVADGALKIATVMTVTLSVDHRAIDGAVAAQWLALFQRNVENPLSMLI